MAMSAWIKFLHKVTLMGTSMMPMMHIIPSVPEVDWKVGFGKGAWVNPDVLGDTGLP